MYAKGWVLFYVWTKSDGVCQAPAAGVLAYPGEIVYNNKSLSKIGPANS